MAADFFSTSYQLIHFLAGEGVLQLWGMNWQFKETNNGQAEGLGTDTGPAGSPGPNPGKSTGSALEPLGRILGPTFFTRAFVLSCWV